MYVIRSLFLELFVADVGAGIVCRIVEEIDYICFGFIVTVILFVTQFFTSSFALTPGFQDIMLVHRGN